MSRYNDKTEVSATLVRDYALAISQTGEMLMSIAAAMDAHNVPVVVTKLYKSGVDGNDMLQKFAAALHEAFGITLANRSILPAKLSTKEQAKEADVTLMKAAEPKPQYKKGKK